MGHYYAEMFPNGEKDRDLYYTPPFTGHGNFNLKEFLKVYELAEKMRAEKEKNND